MTKRSAVWARRRWPRLLQARGVKPRVAIIGEPTLMRVIEGHKGCYEYSVHFTGLEGHGSAPNAG
jgi:acetylornithine deacetylase